MTDHIDARTEAYATVGWWGIYRPQHAGEQVEDDSQESATATGHEIAVYLRQFARRHECGCCLPAYWSLDGRFRMDVTHEGRVIVRALPGE